MRRGYEHRHGNGQVLPLLLVSALIAATLVAIPAAGSAQDGAGYQNLQVLPADISRGELTDIMLANLADLGLPRRANEGCLFCHVGSMDSPSREWDWASDANPMKVKARAMMAMVQEINGTWLASIERTTAGDVSCYTCHAARTNPRPLDELLLDEYRTGGVPALRSAYSALRARYFAADAYDFRTTTLASVARTVADDGAIEDAAAIHQINIDHGADPAANQGLIQLRLTQALDDLGIDAMVARYHRSKAEHPAAAFTPSLLDALAWDLFRSDQQDAGFRLFQLNFAEHPDAYATNESMAWGYESIGDHEAAVAVARAWVDAHPDHELGLRLLSDLTRE